MRYAAELAVDITFRSRGDLIDYLEAIHARTDATSSERAWTILAGLSEYAVGAIAGLRLTGHGSGQLMEGYPDRLAGLARHADGVVTALAEDQEHWEHLLVRGHVIAFTAWYRRSGAHAPLYATQSRLGDGEGAFPAAPAHTREPTALALDR